MDNIFKMAVTSDLHFGNPRIGAEQLYNKLKRFLYPQLEGCHLLVVAGDLYDLLLTVNSKAHRFASIFISDILSMSAKTGMQIRLLHGTFTHDRDQLSIFETITSKLSRFKVINSIECEDLTDFRYNDEVLNNFHLKVGYLPDNLSYKLSDEAVDHLRRAMTCFGWNTLDLLIGHGTFEHTIPPNSGHRPPCLYTQLQFQPVTTGPIVMGHIHTPSRKNNVFYCGSFERMAHGEEEKKGFWVLTCDITKSHSWRSNFIVNELATPFISITPKGDDIPELTRDFVSQVDEKFPTRQGFVRVLHKDTEVRALLHKICAQQFPELSYSSKVIGEKDTIELKIEDIDLDVFEDVKPNEQNLGDLVFQYLTEHDQIEGIPKDVILDKVKYLLMN